MNKNKFILLLSISFPLLSIFVDKYNHIDNLRHSLGIPFNFFWVMNCNLPSNRLEIFKHENLLNINFKLEIYIACVIFFYYFLKLLSLLIQRFNIKKSIV